MDEFDQIAKKAQAEERQRKENYDKKLEEAEKNFSTTGTAVREVKNSYIRELNAKLKDALEEYKEKKDTIVIPQVSEDDLKKNGLSIKEIEDLTQKLADREYYTAYTEAMDKLEKACGAMDVCIRLQNNPAWGETADYEEKQKAVFDAQTALSDCLECLNKCGLYEKSDTKEFEELSLNVTEASIVYENITEGTLETPKLGSHSLNGKFVRTIYAIGEYSPKISAPRKPGENLEYSNKAQRDFSNYALFPQEPSQHDVEQGRLGDCYLLSSLASIAATDPDFIRGAMKDHHNGLVTVRFFDPELKPVYVTVEKTLPQAVNGNDSKDLYARNSLWVGLIEKAYAASGLNGILNSNNYIKAINGNALDFKTMSGGSQHNFLSHFLGNYEYQYRRSNSVAQFIDINDGKSASTIESKARDLGPKLYEAFTRGDFLACGINEETKFQIKGLPTKHAYSIIKVEPPQEDGKQYITVRNPHAGVGLVYKQDGSLIPQKTAGVSRLEMKDFVRYFDDLTMVKTGLTKEIKLGQDKVRLYQKCFGATVKRLASDLDKTTGIFLNHGSPEFKSFLLAAKAADKLLTEGNDPGLMEKGLRRLEEAAENYKFHRVTDNKTAREAAEARPSERYKAACVVENMMKFFHDPELETLVRDNAKTDDFKGHTFDYAEYSTGSKTAPDQADIKDAFAARAEKYKQSLSLMLNDKINQNNDNYKRVSRRMALYKAISDTVGKNMEAAPDKQIGTDEVRRRCGRDALKRYEQVLEGSKNFKNVFRNPDPEALSLLQNASANVNGLNILQNSMRENAAPVNEAEFINAGAQKTEKKSKPAQPALN